MHFTEPRIGLSTPSPAVVSSPAATTTAFDAIKMEGGAASDAKIERRPRSDSADSIESFGSESQREGALCAVLGGGAVFSSFGEQPEIDSLSLNALGGAEELTRAALESKIPPTAAASAAAAAAAASGDGHRFLSEVCLGRLSCKDYRNIAMRYPWDYPNSGLRNTKVGVGATGASGGV